jgi:hypothetical protein
MHLWLVLHSLTEGLVTCSDEQSTIIRPSLSVATRAWDCGGLEKDKANTHECYHLILTGMILTSSLSGRYINEGARLICTSKEKDKLESIFMARASSDVYSVCDPFSGMFGPLKRLDSPAI